MLIKDILAICDLANEYLAAMVTKLFTSLDGLLFSQVVVLGTWLAYHLSQFEYKWSKWIEW